MEITLARALKMKNRLAGQLAKLSQRAIAHNSYVEGSKNVYDAREVFNACEDLRDQLIEVKSKIQIANTPIQDKIIRIGELRSQITILQGMNVTEGPVHSNRWGDEDKEIIRNHVAAVGREERDAWIDTLETEIDRLQDEIDTHNAVTRISLSF